MLNIQGGFNLAFFLWTHEVNRLASVSAREYYFVYKSVFHGVLCSFSIDENDQLSITISRDFDIIQLSKRVPNG